MAIAFVKTVGTQTNKTAGTTLVHTVAAAKNTTTGNALFVMFSWDNVSGGANPTCADSKSNTYVRDVVLLGAGASGATVCWTDNSNGSLTL